MKSYSIELPHQQTVKVDRLKPKDKFIICSFLSYVNEHTSDANSNRRFSPPDKPFVRPAKPMTVFSVFLRLS